MAISEVCKFEFKGMVDKVQKEKRLSRDQAIAIVADECDLLIETARTMDKRARKALVQDEPGKSQPIEIIDKKESPGIIKERKPQGGGVRKGAGRKKSINQEAMWGNVNGQLVRVLQYIERNYVPPVKTSNGTKTEILGNIKLIKMYLE
jgi:hypothetical protein